MSIQAMDATAQIAEVQESYAKIQSQLSKLLNYSNYWRDAPKFNDQLELARVHAVALPWSTVSPVKEGFDGLSHVATERHRKLSFVLRWKGRAV